MIPLYLSIEGLYSYQQKQEVHFDHLVNSQLFGIFGATGSGKSSILEAITFALYGESDRLNKQDGRGYNMMNLKSQKMHIEFIFEAEGKNYKFTVSARRHLKKFDKVESADRAAYEERAGTWHPIPHDSAPSIIGLSYKNFRRTIIIPQGKFQEFLQLSDTERTRMLKDIFYLDKYELYEATIGLERKNSDRMIEKKTQLHQVSEVQQEGIDTLAEQLTQSKEQETRNQHLIQERQTSLQEMEQLKELFQRLDQQRTYLTSLQEKQGEMEAREKRLQQYETCLLHFNPLLEKQQTLSQQLDEQQSEFTHKQNEIQQNRIDLTKAEEAFLDVEKEFHQREQLLRKAEQIEKIASLKEMQIMLADKESRIHKGKTYIEKTQAEVKELAQKEQQLYDKLSQLQEKKPDLTQLLRVKEWYQQKEQILKEVSRLEAEHQRYASQQDRLLSEKRALLQDIDLEPIQFDLSFPQLDNLLSDSILSLQQNKSQTDQSLQHYQLQAKLQDLSHTLEEGKACPLCGSTHHPSPIQVSQVREQLKRLEKEQTDYQSSIHKLEHTKQSLFYLKDQVNILQTDKERSQQSLHTKQDELAQHHQSFQFEPYRPDQADEIKRQLDMHQQMEIHITQIQQENQQLFHSRQQLEKKLQTYTERLQELEQEKGALEVHFQSTKQSLSQIQFDDYAGHTQLQLEKEVAQLRTAYQSIEKLHQTSQQRIYQLKDRISRGKGETDMLQDQIQEAQQQLIRTQQQLKEQLEREPFESLAEVEAILELALNTGAERLAIKQFNQDLDQAKGKEEELSQQVVGKSFEAGQYEGLKMEIALLQEKQTKLMREIGGYERELEQLKAKFAQKQQWEKEMAAFEKRQEQILTLKKLFARSGFVNYVSSVFLHQLCEAANHRFARLTRNALRLEVTANNQFQVRDYLHAGQTRSIKTLSGGQTFQASLCLALALADQVQKQAQSPQNFFFLDEGFGSQDKASLQVIFQTLTSLRKENRIVGIISHVEELQQEIDTYLQIQLDSEKGSRISGNWES